MYNNIGIHCGLAKVMQFPTDGIFQKLFHNVKHFIRNVFSCKLTYKMSVKFLILLSSSSMTLTGATDTVTKTLTQASGNLNHTKLNQ